jgi:Zn-dependent protease
MNESVPLGRIFGVRVGLNWSVIVLMALLIWTLSSGVFPDTDPGLSTTAHIAMATIATVLFLASILLHELGHTVQAQRDGMRTDGITLWMFGGVARISGMFPSAGAEFRIAIAGPVVSLVLGLAFLGLYLIPGVPHPTVSVAFYLGYINLALLIFNLLPALPLDGGRVLRAALWRGTGDFRRGTEIASAIGRVLAYAMIGAGLLVFIAFGGLFSGVWLAFIGWFLLQASAAESRSLLARQAFEGLRVRDVMVPSPVTVSPWLTLGQFMDQTVWANRYTTYPVVSGSRTLGLLPFRRVARVPRELWAEATVLDTMIPLEEVPVVAPDDDLLDAMSVFEEGGLNRALVLDDGRLAGLLSVTDVARVLSSSPHPAAV